ncbi:MAG: transposase [Methanosarcinaceae archaeon]
MDKKLLKVLGLHSLNEETLTLLKYALGEINAKKGAEMLNISSGAFRARAWRIRNRKDTLGPYDTKTGPKTRYKIEGYDVIIKTCRNKNLSESEISHVIKETRGVTISAATIGRFLKDAGFERMQRRTRRNKEKAMETMKETILDYKNKHREDIEQPREEICRSYNAGLFLFAPLIESNNLMNIINPIPESEKAKRYFLAILALKLIGKKRRSDIKFMLEDEGLALFTGGDTVPCSSSLHSFDYDMRDVALKEMKKIYIELVMKYMDFSVIHIDFHTTPHFGDSKEMEINHIATRGKNMKGALIFLVQDKESKMFPYSNANVKRSEASAEIKKFLDMVKPLGIKPEWIVMDSKVTDYENIEKISREGVNFITIRYRSMKMVEEANDIKDWETVRIKRTKGGYAKVRAHEETINPYYKSSEDGDRKKIKLRQIIVTDNGREKPMFIITTDFDHSLKDIIELYPPRWLIELGIKAETKFFDLNQLASDLNVKIDFDTFLTQIAHTLYRLMAKNLRGYENSDPDTLYNKFVQGWGRIYNYEDKIIVCLNKKRATGCLINAKFLDGWVDGGKYISWLGKKLEFVWM